MGSDIGVEHKRKSFAEGNHDGTIAAAWERFLGGDNIPGNAVRGMVETSWRRCLKEGVDPVKSRASVTFDEDELDKLRQRNEDLIWAAKPTMAQARAFLSESQTLMILTDPNGAVLWVEGDPGARVRSEDIQLVPGAVWDESITGTNAIGTALVSQQPIQIFASEHFCEGIKRWSCSATVIHDPYDGRTLGVLDISGLSGSHNRHCLALAVTGAGRIEGRLASLDMKRRGRLLDVALNDASRWASCGLVLFDHRGRLVRANEDADSYLKGKGLDLGVLEPSFVSSAMRGELDLHSDKSWISSDRFEPVVEKNERLGTLLVLPALRRSSSQSPRDRTHRDPPKDPFSAIVGESDVIRTVKQKARRLARVPVPVLILGPTGTGKEVFARALHMASEHRSGPFVPINCGAMTRELLASELFGYAEGAFTGARRGGMMGKFEAANGGTLFLDEIGEMPLELQAHLLRVLEEGEIYRLGETRARKIHIRLLAATNRNLRDEVGQGRFRMDLFYRLAVMTLRLPSLIERRDDIPRLVHHFIETIRKDYNLSTITPAPEVLHALNTYEWPGNIRELRNVIEGMALLSDDGELGFEDLPPEITSSESVTTHISEVTPPQQVSPRGEIAESERDAIVNAIAMEKGNLTRSAARLGIAKSTLYEKMKRYNVDRVSAIRMHESRK